MEKDTIVTLTLKREELLLLHTALCEQRAKLGNTISELASFDLPTDDAQAACKSPRWAFAQNVRGARPVSSQIRKEAHT